MEWADKPSYLHIKLSSSLDHPKRSSRYESKMVMMSSRCWGPCDRLLIYTGNLTWVTGLNLCLPHHRILSLHWLQPHGEWRVVPHPLTWTGPCNSVTVEYSWPCSGQRFQMNLPSWTRPIEPWWLPWKNMGSFSLSPRMRQVEKTAWPP